MSLLLSEVDRCVNDNSFGVVVGCRGNFDFTLKFELIIFAITPSCLFLASGLWRSCWLLGQPDLTSGRRLQITKQVSLVITFMWTYEEMLKLLQIVIVSLAALNLTILILVCTTAIKLRILSITSNVLSLLLSLLCAALSWFEHSKSLRPSILLNGFLFLSLLPRIVETRTFLLEHTTSTIGRVFSAGTCLQVLILLLESLPKRRWVRFEDQDRAPEETTGPIGLSLFTWLNPLLLRGRAKVLVPDDLPKIPRAMLAEHVENDIWLAFHRLAPRPTVRLFHAIVKTLRWNLFKPVL